MHLIAMPCCAVLATPHPALLRKKTGLARNSRKTSKDEDHLPGSSSRGLSGGAVALQLVIDSRTRLSQLRQKMQQESSKVAGERPQASRYQRL